MDQYRLLLINCRGTNEEQSISPAVLFIRVRAIQCQVDEMPQFIVVVSCEVVVAAVVG